MNKILCLLFFILSIGLIGCSDDDSDDVQEFKVYSHLGSGKPTVLNSIADLSGYIDLEINVSDLSIATAQYDWEGEGFIITPIKEGTTIVTVKEKNSLKYKIKVIVEYEGAGNWHIEDSKITVQSDADIKEIIEQDMLERSLFYDQNQKLLYFTLSFENEYAILRGNAKEKSTIYRFIKETQEYEFTTKSGVEKYQYKFSLQSKSDIGVKPQQKSGTYSIDRTKEYQEKYPDKNIKKVIEEQKVKCIYNEL